MKGNLPIPRCTVVRVTDVAERWGLPSVSSEQRAEGRRKLVRSFDTRFGQRRTTEI
jgi:hypothetical protein